MNKKKFIYVLWFFIIFINLNIWGEESSDSPEYFYPEISSWWPDFCLNHITKFPEECSAQIEDENGNFFLEYLEEGSSTFHVDKDIIYQIENLSQFIPKSEYICDFIFCNKCNSPVIRNIFWDDYEEETVLCYKCKCLKYWYDSRHYYSFDFGDDDDEDEYEENDDAIVYDYWDRCSIQANFSHYFDVRAKQYFYFLKEHLTYLKDNQECNCYWPSLSKIACEISNAVTDKMYWLIANYSLRFDKDLNMYPYLTGSAIYGMLYGLFTHTFFYTQYREVLLGIARWSELNHPENYEVVEILDNIYRLIDEIQPIFLGLYSNCLEMHSHPKIYYERGMIYFHQGETFKSINDIRSLITICEENNFQELLTSDLYFKEGQIYTELGLYDKAIEALSKSIQKDPNNKEAYLNRAECYFELGNFDASLEDYINSEHKIAQIDSNDFKTLAFAKGLILGTMKGSAEGIKEFVPSALSSVYGLGHGLWSFVSNPDEFSKDLVNACYDCISYLKNHSTLENIALFVPELKELVTDWDNLDDKRKGELIGFTIGKYGIDILMFYGSTKAINVYRNLKKANNLFTLEKCALSAKNTEKVLAETAKRINYREEILKSSNLKIQWDKQAKHLKGHANYLNGRSIFEHPNPESLIKKFAGTGIKEGNAIPGTPGFKEVVDFGEFIGYAVDEETKEKIATTWGKIHYAKDGVHIVPTTSKK